MRRAVLLLSPAVAALALFACEDSGSVGGPGVFVQEAGSFEASPPSEAGPVVDSAVPPKNVTVSVVRGGGAGAGLNVVFHDAAGAVLEAKVTGADGKATSSDGIIPAQASLLLGGGGSRHVITWTGVEPGDELIARDDSNLTDLGGTYNVTTLGDFTDGGATTLSASIGECTGFNTTSPIPVYLGAPCTSPTTAILARALGATSNVLAYAYVKGKPAPPNDAGSAAATVGPWLAPTTITVTPKNVAVGAFAEAVLYEIAGGLGIANDTGSNLDPSGLFQVAPGFADAYQAGIRLQPNAGGGSTITIAKRAAPATSYEIDLAGAPPALESATLVTTTVMQPQADWTTAGGASLGTMDGGAVLISWSDQTESGGTWTLIVPPGTKTVRAPALPAAVAAWAPRPPTDAGGGVTFNDPIVVFAEADIFPGYAAFRKGVGLLAPLTQEYQVDSRAILPANGTIKLTSYRKPQPTF